MKRALPSLAFCALCVSAWAVITGPPSLPSVNRPHKSAAVHQGAGATKLIAKTAPTAPPTTNTFTWLFAPGANPSNYWWNIEASSDLVNWIVVITNASGPGEVRVKRTDPPGFYRLSGRSSL